MNKYNETEQTLKIKENELKEVRENAIVNGKYFSIFFGN